MSKADELIRAGAEVHQPQVGQVSTAVEHDEALPITPGSRRGSATIGTVVEHDEARPVTHGPLRFVSAGDAALAALGDARRIRAQVSRIERAAVRAAHPTGRTLTWSNNRNSSGLSPAWRGVTRTDMGRPRPSTASWILLVSPTPGAPEPLALDRNGLHPVGPAAPFYGHQPRADALERSSSPQRRPTPPCRRRRLSQRPRRGCNPTSHLLSSAEAAHALSSTGRSAPGDHGTVPLSAASRGSR
jgi:hypothetical protein